MEFKSEPLYNVVVRTKGQGNTNYLLISWSETAIVYQDAFIQVAVVFAKRRDIFDAPS
jgi:hypothetical protein